MSFINKRRLYLKNLNNYLFIFLRSFFEKIKKKQKTNCFFFVLFLVLLQLACTCCSKSLFQILMLSLKKCVVKLFAGVSNLSFLCKIFFFLWTSLANAKGCRGIKIITAAGPHKQKAAAAAGIRNLTKQSVFGFFTKRINKEKTFRFSAFK